MWNTRRAMHERSTGPVNRKFSGILAAVCVLLTSTGRPARSDVVVLDNRSPETVEFAAAPATRHSQAKSHVMAPRDVLPIPTRGRLDVRFVRDGQTIKYRLNANAAYYFSGSGTQRDLYKIDLGGDAETAEGRPIGTDADLDTMGSLPVLILADDDQRYARPIWEQTYRDRIQAASAILEKHCRLRLEVTAVQTWDSEDRVKDFSRSLLEFSQEVDPGTAHVAIGFTSQYHITRGTTRLGGTYGPFRSHILIREWAQHVSEAERLELLVHELGHHVGAAHSPEPDSVMRPILGDRRARQLSFPIRFDAVNTLAMYLVAEEIRLRNARDIADLSASTRSRLRQIFTELSYSLPKDPAAKQYLRLLSPESD